jgi:hypothetical protein
MFIYLLNNSFLTNIFKIMQKTIEIITEYLQTAKKHVCSILFDDSEGVQCTLKSVSLNAENGIIFTWEDDMMLDVIQDLETVLNSSFAHIFDVVAKEIGNIIELAKPKPIEVEIAAIPTSNTDSLMRIIGNNEVFKFADIQRELWQIAVQTWEANENEILYNYTIKSISRELVFSCEKREIGFDVKVIGKSKKDGKLVERVRKPAILIELQVGDIPKHVLSSFSKLEQKQNDLARDKAEIASLPKQQFDVTTCTITSKNFLSMLKKAEGLYKTESDFFKESAQVLLFRNGIYFSGLCNMQGKDSVQIEEWNGNEKSLLIPLNLDRHIKLSSMVAQLPNCNLQIFNEVEIGTKKIVAKFYFTSPFGKYEIAIDGEENAKYTVDELEKNSTIKTTCSMQIQASEFRNAINTCSNFVSKDDLRPAMCGVYVDMFASKFVATNAHILVVVPTEIEMAEGSQKENFILPIEEVKAFLATIPVLYTGYVVIELKGIFAELSSGNSSSIVRLVQAGYPDYNSVMPKNNDNKVTVLKHDLQKSLRRIKPYCNSAAPIASLYFNNECLTLSGSNATLMKFDKFDNLNGAIKIGKRYKTLENNTITEEEFYYTWEKGIDTVQVDTVNFLCGDTNTEMMPCVGNCELSASFTIDILLTCIGVSIEDNICFNLASNPHKASLIEAGDKTILIMPAIVEQIVCPPNTTKIHKVENVLAPCDDEMLDEDPDGGYLDKDWTDTEVQQYEKNELGVE